MTTRTLLKAYPFTHFAMKVVTDAEYAASYDADLKTATYAAGTLTIGGTTIDDLKDYKFAARTFNPSDSPTDDSLTSLSDEGTRTGVARRNVTVPVSFKVYSGAGGNEDVETGDRMATWVLYAERESGKSFCMFFTWGETSQPHEEGGENVVSTTFRSMGGKVPGWTA